MMTGSGGMIKKRQFGAPPEMDSSYKPKKAAPGAPPQQSSPGEVGGSQKVAGPPGGTGTGVPGAPTMQENLTGPGPGGGTTGGQQMHPLTPQPQPTPAAVPSMQDMIKTNQQTMAAAGLGPGGQPPGSPGAPPMPGGAEQIGTPPSAGMAGKAPKTQGTANQGGGTTAGGSPSPTSTTGVYHTMDQPGQQMTMPEHNYGQPAPPPGGGYAPPQLPETAGAGLGGNAGPGFDPYQAPEADQAPDRNWGALL